MENYKIKTSFVIKACDKKTDIIIYDFYFSNRGKMWKFDFNMKLNMIFQYGLEPVLIQRK